VQIDVVPRRLPVSAAMLGFCFVGCYSGLWATMYWHVLLAALLHVITGINGRMHVVCHKPRYIDRFSFHA
jgi:hypothetical protein